MESRETSQVEEMSLVEMENGSALPKQQQQEQLGYQKSSSYGTLIVTRKIMPQFNDLHEDWLLRIQTACAKSEGFVKRQVYPPTVDEIGQDFWTHVVTFDCLDNAKKWSNSTECQAFMEEIAPWVAEDSMGFVLTDPQGALTFGIMPTGSSGSVAHAPLPIKYRQCIVIIINLYPVMLVSAWGMEFFYGNAFVHMPLRLLIAACLSVPCLTFYMIPFCMKYLGPWSYGSTSLSRRKQTLTTIGLLVFVGLMSVFTSLIWPDSGYAGSGIFGD